MPRRTTKRRTTARRRRSSRGSRSVKKARYSSSGYGSGSSVLSNLVMDYQPDTQKLMRTSGLANPFKSPVVKPPAPLIQMPATIKASPMNPGRLSNITDKAILAARDPVAWDSQPGTPGRPLPSTVPMEKLVPANKLVTQVADAYGKISKVSDLDSFYDAAKEVWENWTPWDESNTRLSRVHPELRPYIFPDTDWRPNSVIGRRPDGKEIWYSDYDELDYDYDNIIHPLTSLGMSIIGIPGYYSALRNTKNIARALVGSPYQRYVSPVFDKVAHYLTPASLRSLVNTSPSKLARPNFKQSGTTLTPKVAKVKPNVKLSPDVKTKYHSPEAIDQTLRDLKHLPPSQRADPRVQQDLLNYNERNVVSELARRGRGRPPGSKNQPKQTVSTRQSQRLANQRND